jgi:hypothetical protein
MDDYNLDEISKKYEIPGESITNMNRFSSMKALNR